ncbi:hypothetical protein EDC01DRAFT_635053 [Geopyxis carbonaria]|nr:hypothetical protein EDC01DRAFT_635053 [Geopyxis carbonaria]
MACEACIRGHRVSGCNHHDRKLLPIAKKGRPVSQCNHCRHMRKSRAAHIKCDCGERLALLKEQAKNGGKPHPSAIPPVREAGSHTDVATATPAVGDSKSELAWPPGDQTSCPCSHGGRCTCALKKEPQHLDAVPEFSAPPISSSISAPALDTVRTKPRLTMTHSESSLTTFANGHHKPTHKHHSSIHGSSPYSIPTVGHTGHTFGEHNGCHKAPTASAPPSVAQKPRRIKSEQSSPDLRTYPALQMTNTGITPLELTPRPEKPSPMNRTPSGRMRGGLSVDTNHQSIPMQSFHSHELLPSADSDGFQFSAGLHPPYSAGWPPSFSQYDSTSSFDDQLAENQRYEHSMDLETFLRMNQPPALTNSTSGDEVDDLGALSGPSPPYLNGVLSSDSSDQDASDNYGGLSTASSYVGLPQVGMPPHQMPQSGFEGGEFDRLLVTSSSMPVSMPGGAPVDPFDTGIVAGADDLFGVGMPFPDAGFPDMAAKAHPHAHDPPLMSPPITTPGDDNDFLWMASWSGPQSGQF